MSQAHWLVLRGKVIWADSPLPSVSRPRMSGPQLFSLFGETLSVTTVWPVLLTTVKFCWAWPPAASPPAVLPALLLPAGAAGAAALVVLAGAAALLAAAPLLQAVMASAEASKAPVR